MKYRIFPPVSATLLAAFLPLAADPLDDAILRHRTGVLVIRTAPGTEVTVEQLRHEFWFGATIATGIFNGRIPAEDAARWKEVFLSHFNAGVIEAAFKWHEMEKERGKVDYSIVDSMLEWASANGIPVRGHCIFWGIPRYVPEWLKPLGDAPLRLAVRQRARSIAARYRGQFAEYDLNNEMIHGNWFEERLGPEITRDMARWVKEADPEAVLFFNDYDITTGRRLDDYVKHIRTVLSSGAPMDGIGVQGHLHGDSFDEAELRRALDTLAGLRLPVRITEFNFPGQRSKYYQKRDLQLSPEEEAAKADALRRFFRICFAHPAVTGILMWGFWEGANWIPQSSLYRRDWTPTPAAGAYRRLVFGEWWTRATVKADSSGLAAVRAFFGTHRVRAGGREETVALSRREGAKGIDMQ
ncbi:MAG: endo-1,4-beta-xylanase [Bryobacteraceae bacterium]|nr:endo-1,4-beta-xylanase [Bryobacteraceae bacterium]